MSENPTPQPPATTGPGTHCPRCHKVARLNAHNHCKGGRCNWLVCNCNAVWDPVTGNPFKVLGKG